MLKPGDRIKLVAMPDDPHPIPAGSTGTVEETQYLSLGGRSSLQVCVKWDNGRNLALVMPPDTVEIIEAARKEA